MKKKSNQKIKGREKENYELKINRENKFDLENTKLKRELEDEITRNYLLEEEVYRMKINLMNNQKIVTANSSDHGKFEDPIKTVHKIYHKLIKQYSKKLTKLVLIYKSTNDESIMNEIEKTIGHLKKTSKKIKKDKLIKFESFYDSEEEDYLELRLKLNQFVEMRQENIIMKEKLNEAVKYHEKALNEKDAMIEKLKNDFEALCLEKEANYDHQYKDTETKIVQTEQENDKLKLELKELYDRLDDIDRAKQMLENTLKQKDSVINYMETLLTETNKNHKKSKHQKEKETTGIQEEIFSLDDEIDQLKAKMKSIIKITKK